MADKISKEPLDRLVGAVPGKYREKVAQVAHRLRELLPPVIVQHRIDALEQHLDRRLSAIEAKVEQILQRLEKR
ncbi:MAG TPA: hypothetical protein VMK12_20825 [Anaeromyxobacteraceae bacterium]|nr:hypothetical protein [Anaeromyxobacteraceae bacterium]